MNWLELVNKVKKCDPTVNLGDEVFAIHITDTVTLWCWSDKEIRITSEDLKNYIRVKIKIMNSFEDMYKLVKILTAKEEK